MELTRSSPKRPTLEGRIFFFAGLLSGSLTLEILIIADSYKAGLISPLWAATFIAGVVAVLGGMSAFIMREMIGRRRAVAELEDARRALRERLPRRAQELLTSPARTFYFLDERAVEGLYAQIRGPVRLTEARKRSRRGKAKMAQGRLGPLTAAGSTRVEDDLEEIFAARPTMVVEFDEVLRHMVERNEIAFGIDQAEPTDPAPREDDVDPREALERILPSLDYLKEIVRGLDNATAYDASDIRAMSILAELLHRFSTAKGYIFVEGKYAISCIAGERRGLGCVHPQWAVCSERVQKAASPQPKLTMEVCLGDPGVTSAGLSAFTRQPGTVLKLQAVAKVLSWRDETRTLELVPIAIF